MRYAKAISIGASCQPAKQIRTLLGQTEAYFFDWMISPLPAVLRAYETDFVNLLQAENLSYSDHRKIRLRDAANGLEYQHDFPVDANNADPAQREVILPDFADHVAIAQEKYARRLERTREVLDAGEPILIVRYVNTPFDLEPANRKALAEIVRSKHPSAQLTFLWASPLVSDFTRSAEGYICTLPHSPKWDGCPIGWGRVLEFCGMLPALDEAPTAAPLVIPQPGEGRPDVLGMNR